MKNSKKVKSCCRMSHAKPSGQEKATIQPVSMQTVNMLADVRGCDSPQKVKHTALDGPNTGTWDPLGLPPPPGCCTAAGEFPN